MNELHRYYLQLRDEATRLAGKPHDLAQRASVYHHLYRHSKGNHVFPLIAAHGALWAGGYFQMGIKMGQLASLPYFFLKDFRNNRLHQLDEFADAFREVNRLICVDTYVKYHFTAKYGGHELASQFVEPDLLEGLIRCHAARKSGIPMSENQKRDLFETFFMNEQETVVGPRITAAANAFDWPLIKAIAIRPLIRFTFLGPFQFFWFRNFVNQEERVQKGLQVYDVAARKGFDAVETSLEKYRVLPARYLENPELHFDQVRHRVMAA